MLTYVRKRVRSTGSFEWKGNRTRKVNGAVVVGVDLVDHVLKLGLGGVLAEGAHDGAQLLGGDLSYRLIGLSYSVLSAGILQSVWNLKNRRRSH